MEKISLSLNLVNQIMGYLGTRSCLVYCNGSTDYIETYGYVNGTGTLSIAVGPNDSYFQACLVRGA